MSMALFSASHQFEPSTMPLLAVREGEITINMELLRLYLRNTHATTPEDIMSDAFWLNEPGALYLVELVMISRGNPRTRRRLFTAQREWRRLKAGEHNDPRPRPARWYNRLQNAVLGQHRLLRSFAYPTIARASSRSLTEGHPQGAGVHWCRAGGATHAGRAGVGRSA